MFHSSLDRQIVQAQGLADLQISDTVSESSDNATILSLSREDLTQIGAGPIREDVRVSRKKLEALILSGKIIFFFFLMKIHQFRLPAQTFSNSYPCPFHI